MNAIDQLGVARLGDFIETTIKFPYERVVRMHLVTPESCAHANGLLMNKIGGWRVVRQGKNEVLDGGGDELQRH